MKAILNPYSHRREGFLNRKLLKTLTVCHRLSYARELAWEKVKSLAIVGTSKGTQSNIFDERCCYVDAAGEWVLLINPEKYLIQNYLNRCADGHSANLEHLFICGTSVTGLFLSDLVFLRELHLIENNELTGIFGLERLAELRILNIRRSVCNFTLDLTAFTKLRELYLTDSEATDVRLKCVLPELLVCDLKYARITNLRFLENCPALEKLYFLQNPIEQVPDAISRMKNLQYLCLWNLQLKGLPGWLSDMGLAISRKQTECGISLWQTKVEDVDMSIFDQSQEMIRDWFRSYSMNGKEAEEATGNPLNEIKVVFLGDGSAGKSLTIARLLRDGMMPQAFDGEATPGIAIEDQTFVLPDGRSVRVHFWDFGGQEILHCMHRIFLTERTLYVIVINARNNTQDDQARYWLHNVNSFAPDCPVMLVLNQIDENPNASINERNLRKLYPKLKEIVRMSALTYDRETFNGAFRWKLLEQIAEIESLGTIFPPSWKRIMGQLRDMKSNYIRGQEYSELCRYSGINDREIQRDLLRWFNDIGVSFCWYKSPRLQDYVVLKPEWITNAIYTIIWNKRAKVANGMVERNEIYNLLSPDYGSGIKMVRPDMKYDKADVDYILRITRQFRLSFPMDMDHEFFPMLCHANELPEDDAFLNDPHVIEVKMEYDYLPHNVLHRLMVDKHHDLIQEKVWFTGARFWHKRNCVDALVKSEGDVLFIYIRATDPEHRAHSYLNDLRSALDSIHKEMGLKEPETSVAYREDDQVDYFPYEMLEGTRRNNVEMVYSRVFRRMIPIADILNRSDSQVVQKREKLLRDVAKAIIQLQENRLMADAAEDNRNDTLCTALRNMGYNMADQTHVGWGGTGKRAGSLDLRIYHEDNLPWTNLEAMNLKSASDSQLTYWDDHLKRLMDNYDPAGLPLLFLISYVNCTEAQYHKLWSAYTEHMRFHSPDKAELRHGTLSSVRVTPDQTAYLQVAKCTYDLSGTPVTVYHYFAGFIEQ